MTDTNSDVQKQKPKTSPKRILVIVLIGIVLGLGLKLIIDPCRVHVDAYRLLCGTNLHGLGRAMSLYITDFDEYCTAEKWCDLLIENEEISSKMFRCKESGAIDGECSYAFNRNIVGKNVSDVTPDTVLLFETKKGWNQVGGAEILTTENHGGQGCNVVFNDGHVEFVKTDELGELNWMVQDTNIVGGD